MLVTFSPSLSAKIQPDTISANAAAGDSFVARQRSQCCKRFTRGLGASGVSSTPGGNNRAINQGKQRSAVKAGTAEAINHFPKPIGCHTAAPACSPMGLAEVAVIHRADDTARLAMAQNIR